SPFEFVEVGPGHERMQPLEKTHGSTDARPERIKFDDKLTFSKLSDVYASGTMHDEDQSCHLHVLDPKICVDRCTKEFGNPFKNFIGGKWVASKSKKTFPNRNPADLTEIIGEFPAGDGRGVDAAVAAAKKAYDGWRRTPAPKRGELILKVGQILTRRKEEIAR